jgi:hypothetical protein
MGHYNPDTDPDQYDPAKNFHPFAEFFAQANAHKQSYARKEQRYQVNHCHGKQMGICRNTRLKPTAKASMLVASGS